MIRARRAAVATLAAAIALVAASSAGGPPEVRGEGGRLWIRADGVAAVELLAAVSAETDVAFELDPGAEAGKVSLEVEGEDVERAVRRVIDALPSAGGHSLAYAGREPRQARLVAVRIFAIGSSPAAPAPTETPEPRVVDPPLARLAPTPFPEERIESMRAAGVPRETAERVVELAEDMREIHDEGTAGAFSPDDLSPESRSHLPGLLDRGIPVGKAVRMLLIQERYRETLAEIRRTQRVR